MKRRILTIALLMILLMGSTMHVLTTPSSKLTPLVIGYCQGEDYYEFDYALNYLILALEEEGMIGSLDGKLTYDTPSKVTWSILQQEDQSSWQVRFDKDAYFSFTDSAYVDLSEEELQEVIRNTVRSNNVGLMVACGTTASLTVKGLSGDCGIISLAADPLKSEIVSAVETSQRTMCGR